MTMSNNTNSGSTQAAAPAAPPKPFRKLADSPALLDLEARLKTAIAQQAKAITAWSRRISRLETAAKAAKRRDDDDAGVAR